MKSPAICLVAASLILISSFSALAQTVRSARVIAEKANLRETPSIVGLAEGEVPEGTIVKILDEKLPWYVVRVGDRVGWMHGAALAFVNSQDESEPFRNREPAKLNGIPEQVYHPPPAKPESRSSRSTRSRGYTRGPRGGCYYISGSGRKVYVDRSMCN